MPSTPRIRLVILFGGHSAEHDISRVSAYNVLRAANRDRYDLHAVGIDRDGTWRSCDTAVTAVEGGDGSLRIDGPEVNPFDVIRGRASGEVAAPDQETVVFPVLHGPNGEDGTVQGLLEVASVAYVGSGVLGSAVSMDKAIAKTILGAHGIAQPDWRSLRRDQIESSEGDSLIGALVDQLGQILFVKPANMGSSIGVSKTHDLEELRTAITMALNYDDVIVIEEAVTAREIETAVLGNENPRVGSIGEIIAAAEFYDYEDKYRDGSASTIIPAVLGAETEATIRDVAVATYRALRAEGLARVDLFVNEDHPDPDKRVMVNEINTIPGFTPISMYPQLWEHSGVGYSELIDELVDLARARYARVNRHHVDVISGRHD